jgi:hypothetical protein
MTQSGAQQLDCVMQSNERAREHGWHGEFDHHDPIDGGCGEHHNRPKSRLYQPRRVDN